MTKKYLQHLMNDTMGGSEPYHFPSNFWHPSSSNIKELILEAMPVGCRCSVAMPLRNLTMIMGKAALPQFVSAQLQAQ